MTWGAYLTAPARKFLDHCQRQPKALLLPRASHALAGPDRDGHGATTALSWPAQDIRGR